MKKNPQIMNNEIESQSGYSKVPLGKAGPLKLFGSYARGEFILPLATSEITLVASVNRGCKVTKLSGGIKTYVLKDTITRTPLYRTADVSSALKLSKFIKENLGILKEIAGSTTNHGELIKTEEWVIGNLVFVRFHLSPGDAMGMHMITIAVDEISKYIVKENRCDLVSLSSNLCSDKKPSGINFLLGRGVTVIAEAIIKKEDISHVLKVKSGKIVDLVNYKNIMGSAVSLAPTHLNAHFANIIAAIFISCGQDVASTVESSMGVTTAELRKNDALYMSVTLPSLIIGTVGGGTDSETAKQALEMLNCANPDEEIGLNRKKFGEIIAGACLAGELSLLASLAKGDLAEAVKKFRTK